MPEKYLPEKFVITGLVLLLALLSKFAFADMPPDKMLEAATQNMKIGRASCRERV